MPATITLQPSLSTEARSPAVCREDAIELTNAMELRAKVIDPVILANAVPRGSGLNSIFAGLSWLARAYRDGQWLDSASRNHEAGLCVTACTLARLGEFPSEYIPQDLQEQIKTALDRLEATAMAGSGWSRWQGGEADAFTTAWAILALRCHRRVVPRAAIEFLLRCREPNGGFTAHPEHAGANGSRNGEAASAEITATALRALSMCDRAGGDFAIAQLRNDISATPAGKSSRFYVCSEILDWESGLAPWPLLNLVSQSAIQFDLGKPYEQALLLRILSRLRNQRAWLAAASLNKMQLPDGSWAASSGTAQESSNGAAPIAPPPAEPGVLCTVTALSALVMHECGPDCSYSSSRKQRSLF